MNINPKLLIIMCVIGLGMSLASAGYAQSDGGPGASMIASVAEEASADAPDAAPVVVPAVVTAQPAPPVEAAVAVIPATSESALSKLSTELMNILIPVFLALVTLLVTKVGLWMRKKLGIQVSDESIAAWARLAERAAARGSEWARNKAKDLAEGQKVPGPDVLDVALDWAVEMGKAFGLPEIGREKLIGLIEAQLNTQRLQLE